MSKISTSLYKEITEITSALISDGISVEQNFPSIKCGNTITFENDDLVSNALKKISYNDLYSILEKKKCFNMKFKDGAIIQLMYFCENNMLKSHRLAYYPHPHLENYLEEYQIYDEDDIYGDIVIGKSVPFPIRFDYSDDISKYKEIFHAKSHLTFGDYKNFRLPVSCPVSPKNFIIFLMRNFYFDDENKFKQSKIFAMKSKCYFEDTLSNKEKNNYHFVIK